MKSKRASRTLLLLLIFGLVIIVGGAGALLGFKYLHSPINPANTTDQVVVITRGQTLDSIGQKLTEANLIRTPAIFKLTVMREGLSKKIQAGSFKLNQSMTVTQIAQTLTQGRLDFWVTILEGWRREEIATYLEKAYSENGLQFDREHFLSLTQDKEGYLYPDSYLLPLTASTQTAVNQLTNTFDQKVTAGLSDQIAANPLSLNEIITLASLIEREAKTDTTRRQIAGILLNRLDIGMPLQVDATLQFAKGYNAQKQDWWAPPLSADKAIVSPYNTYQNPGIPPAPICSPSLSSIQAVLNPIPSNYLFYITGNDGQMYYAQTLDQHNTNITRYLR